MQTITLCLCGPVYSNSVARIYFECGVLVCNCILLSVFTMSNIGLQSLVYI